MTAPRLAPGAAQRARLTAPGIARAAGALDPAVSQTPLLDSVRLTQMVGARVLLKLETLGPVRSFKGRGTDWFVTRLLEDEGAAPPLVTASAGNFGQGLAWAAGKRGIPVTVFAAENASPLKVERMRELGATVRLAGADLDAAKDAAREFAEADERQRFVEDGRELALAEGAGTIAPELLRQAVGRGIGTPDAVLVPLGNGSLLAGIARWMRAHSPDMRVIGVGPEGAPAMARSVASGATETTDAVRTIADGLAVRVPVPEALDDLRGLVDEVLLVSDDAMIEAMRLVWRVYGVAAEPAGAAGLAAILADRERWRGVTVATPLCGGNLTDAQAREWLLA